MLCRHYISALALPAQKPTALERTFPKTALQIHQELGDVGLQAAENWLYPVVPAVRVKWSCVTKNASPRSSGPRQRLAQPCAKQ